MAANGSLQVGQNKRPKYFSMLLPIFGLSSARVNHNADVCTFQLNQKTRQHYQTKALTILRVYKTHKKFSRQKCLIYVSNRKYSPSVASSACLGMGDLESKLSPVCFQGTSTGIDADASKGETSPGYFNSKSVFHRPEVRKLLLFYFYFFLTWSWKIIPYLLFFYFFFFLTWSWKIIPYLPFYFFSNWSWEIIP